MKKVGGVGAPTGSGLGSTQSPVGGIPMQRLGSAGSRGRNPKSSYIFISLFSHRIASRTPSSLSVRPRESPVPRADSNTPGIITTGLEILT